jgi:hypothetical protein
MINNNKIFIGGKFLDSQLLFTLPIVDGYCEKNKIKTIIYEKDLPHKIINNKNLSKFLKKYQILSLQKLMPFWYKNILLRATFLFIPSLLLAIRFSKKKLLTEKNWFNLQIFHSLWDTSLVSIINKRTTVNFFDIFISSLRITFKLYEQRVLKKNNIIAAFLGHTVYESRSILACLRQYCLHVYCHSNYSFYLQEKFKDLHWSFIKKHIFFKLIKNTSSKKIHNYFKLRERGRGKYEDSRLAALISSKFDKNFIYPENVIMLHIFHDSAFSLIDKNRVFIDYFDWIKKTFKILLDSKERWSIRLHPSYKRWGEDQHLIISDLIKKTKINRDQLFIDDNLTSNTFLFKNVKRLVTYSGTSHLEAATFGIKPIVISEVTLSNFNKKLVLKPRNLEEYRKMILRSSNDKLFKMDKKSTLTSKQILYVRENYLKFQEELKGIRVYRGDPDYFINKDFDIINNSIKNNYDFLRLMGVNFSNNKNYIKPIKF